MNILVTGGAGYIGSHTVIELLNENYEVIVIDNFSNSKPEVLKRIKEITNKDFKFYEIDLTNKDDIEIIFKENHVDAVIHFAGYKAVGESTENPIKYYYNNVIATINLCDIMQKYFVHKMVFSSSATVYDLKNKSPLTEEMTLGATNPYGRTKIIVEQILKDIFDSNNSWSISLLRYFNPIGAHESGKIGEDPNGTPNNLMPFITQVAVGKRDELVVFGNDYDTPDGTGIRDYIHVCDLAKGHIKALNHILNNIGIESYNLGTGTGYSVLDIVRNFEKVTGMKIPYKFSERRPGDIAACFADVEKANKILGWKAEKNIEEMCKDSWRWQQKNPSGFN